MGKEMRWKQTMEHNVTSRWKQNLQIATWTNHQNTVLGEKTLDTEQDLNSNTIL